MKNRLKILELEAKKNLAKIGISSLSFFKFDYGLDILENWGPSRLN